MISSSYWLKDGDNISISSNVIITGDLTVSGTMATLNTDVYATEQVDILYDGSDSVALKIKQTNSTDKTLVAENNTHEVFSISQNGDLNFKGGIYQDGSAFQTSFWDKTDSNLHYTAGYIGIGTNSPPQKLHVIGEIIATNKITSFYSDERLKTDIELIPEPLNIIEQLNGFYYKANELADGGVGNINKTAITHDVDWVYFYIRTTNEVALDENTLPNSIRLVIDFDNDIATGSNYLNLGLGAEMVIHFPSRSVTMFSIVVISFVIRETISPVRRLTKKLSESVCRCLNSLMRKSVIARFSVRSNK